jgi:hypothetical protein
MEYLILVAGFGGGMVRGLIGFTKHQFSFKNVGFNLPYFLGMIFISGVVGLLTSAVIGGDALLAFIAGYAGGDIIENAYKTITKKPSLYNLPDLLRKR